jgi:transketolase C-terminal domain/subunit
MRVIVTVHARNRLREFRQRGIRVDDIVRAAAGIPGAIPVATRFRGFRSISGRTFDLVAKDIFQGRLVITVIGK